MATTARTAFALGSICRIRILTRSSKFLQFYAVKMRISAAVKFRCCNSLFLVLNAKSELLTASFHLHPRCTSMSTSKKIAPTDSASIFAPEKKAARKAKKNADGSLNDSMKVEKKRTAYQEFCELHRAKLKEQGLSFPEVSKKLGEMVCRFYLSFITTHLLSGPPIPRIRTQASLRETRETRPTLLRRFRRLKLRIRSRKRSMRSLPSTKRASLRSSRWMTKEITSSV